jgi:glycogen debranching enzyme
MSDDLDDAARRILKENDQGGFTLPTRRLYPFQWNWDSAFAALGFSTFDHERAWRELETLFDAQWPNGMVPHIVFRKDDPDYFPGPGVWGAGRQPPTSGISQPPVAATVLRRLVEQDGLEATARMAVLFPKLLAWHRWYHAARDPDGQGVIAATHPWETGRDNSPDWDEAMPAVDTRHVAPYQRRDTAHVDPSMRPTKEDYDRYVAILEFGREVGWDPLRIYREGPFLVADPGLTFILLRAERDLLAIAEKIGEAAAAEETRVRIGRLEAGAEKLYRADLGGYVALDLKLFHPATALSSTGFLALYGGITTHAEALTTELKRFHRHARYGVPSFDPEDPRFDPRRYWRGPVWAVVNWLIAQGLYDAGETDLAASIRHDTGALIREAGFAEYFNPLNGEGAGGQSFTWTAAIWLAFASPEAQQPWLSEISP